MRIQGINLIPEFSMKLVMKVDGEQLDVSRTDAVLATVAGGVARWEPGKKEAG